MNCLGSHLMYAVKKYLSRPDLRCKKIFYCLPRCYRIFHQTKYKLKQLKCLVLCRADIKSLRSAKATEQQHPQIIEPQVYRQFRLNPSSKFSISRQCLNHWMTFGATQYVECDIWGSLQMLDVPSYEPVSYSRLNTSVWWNITIEISKLLNHATKGRDID